MNDTNHKVVFLGDSGVGKSSIIHRYITDIFFENISEATIGAAFFRRHVDVDEKKVALDIWDTAGQERFRSLTSMYYRLAQAVIIVYDVTNIESFEYAKKLAEEVINTYNCFNPHKFPVLIMVGNKVDNYGKVQVFEKVAEEYCRNYQIKHISTSAKLRFNITQLFDYIAYEVSMKSEKQYAKHHGHSDVNDSYISLDEDRPQSKCSYCRTN
jgi:small GTP-binding protein